MALPMIATALSGLLRRYGLKGLNSIADPKKKAAAKLALGREAKRNLRKGAPKAEVAKKASSIRRNKALGAAGTDSTAAYMGYDILGPDATKPFKNKKELRDYLKANKPKLWKEFSNSEYTDVEEFLKSKKSA